MIPSPDQNIWEHSQNVRRLYADRAALKAPEMDAARQCARLVRPYVSSAKEPSRTKILDVGCGSGYLWHSLRKAGLDVEYHGLDYSPSLIEIGREIMPGFGLPAERLVCGRAEDLRGRFDLAVMLNTLTFCPDFRDPLQRLIESGVGVILIRDNFGDETVIRWELDGYLDPGYNHLKAYWNQWSFSDAAAFLGAAGFRVTPIVDERCRGRVEDVVGKPYYWSWLLAAREAISEQTIS